MDINELQTLLQGMPLSDTAKKEVLDRQAAGDEPQAIFDLIDSKLEEAAKAAIKDDAELSAEYSKLEAEHTKEVVAAAADFDKEMDAIEAEAKALDQELDKEIDQVRMDELKEEQGKIAA